MLQWLFASVEMNAERAKSYPDYRVAASDGFFMNLAAVCIKLCQPFIQPSAKTWARIDARCGPRYTMLHSVSNVSLVGMLTVDII
jgi:Ubiquitin elongating factor core